MAQDSPALTTGTSDWAEPYEFDIGETVTCLWALNKTALVKGQFRSMNQDDQFLVEYVSDAGELREQLVWGAAIDRITH